LAERGFGSGRRQEGKEETRAEHGPRSAHGHAVN